MVYYSRRYCEYTANACSRLIAPQALVIVTSDKLRRYLNNCFKICALYAGVGGGQVCQSE